MMIGIPRLSRGRYPRPRLHDIATKQARGRPVQLIRDRGSKAHTPPLADSVDPYIGHPFITLIVILFLPRFPVFAPRCATANATVHGKPSAPAAPQDPSENCQSTIRLIEIATL